MAYLVLLFQITELFTSAEFRAFVASSGIKHNLTALYNPQSNGATERFNKVLKEGLTVA